MSSLLLTEESLLTSIQSADGFWAEVEPLLPMAHRLAFAILASQAEAEDAVQDAVLNAWGNAARFKADSAFRPWFLTIVANACRSRRRARWWSVLRIGSLTPQGDGADSAIEEALDIRSAMVGLSSEHKVVLALRFYLDLPISDVAATLGISVQAAKSRIHRALGQLRVTLSEELSDE